MGYDSSTELTQRNENSKLSWKQPTLRCLYLIILLCFGFSVLGGYIGYQLANTKLDLVIEQLTEPLVEDITPVAATPTTVAREKTDPINYAFKPLLNETYEAVIYSDPSVDSTAHIYLRYPNGFERPYTTIRNVAINTANPAAFVGNNLYIIQEYVSEDRTVSERQLWRYRYGETVGVMIATSTSIRFAVSPDQATLAVVDRDPFSQDVDRVRVYDDKVALVRTIYQRELDASATEVSIELLGVSNSTLWLATTPYASQGAVDLIARIDLTLPDAPITVLDKTKAGIRLVDYDFEPETGRLAYSTFPMILETYFFEQVVAYNPTISLLVRDIESGREELITTATFNELSMRYKFSPRWTSTTTLEYIGQTFERRTEVTLF